MNKFRNTKLYKILSGDTKTEQISGSASKIVFNGYLSSQLYDQVDTKSVFTIKSLDGKTFTIKHLKTN